MGAIPRGIEVLVKKASVDPRFRQALLARRSGAAGEIGLLLDPAEALMLNAVPAEHLEAIIAGTKVEPSKVPIFLGKVAAAMLLAIGAMAVDGCKMYYLGCTPETASPSTASAPANQPATAPATGPANAATTAPDMPHATSHGARPDMPMSKGSRPDMPPDLTKPDTSGEKLP